MVKRAGRVLGDEPRYCILHKCVARFLTSTANSLPLSRFILLDLQMKTLPAQTCLRVKPRSRV